MFTFLVCNHPVEYSRIKHRLFLSETETQTQTEPEALRIHGSVHIQHQENAEGDVTQALNVNGPLLPKNFTIYVLIIVTVIFIN